MKSDVHETTGRGPLGRVLAVVAAIALVGSGFAWSRGDHAGGPTTASTNGATTVSNATAVSATTATAAVTTTAPTGPASAAAGSASSTVASGAAECDPGLGSVQVSAWSSPEKFRLFNQLVERYNARGCGTIQASSKSSGDAEKLLEGKLTDGPQLWSPASSMWGELLNARAKTKIVDSGAAVSMMQTPLVLAMPTSVSTLVGNAPGFGFKDLVSLAERGTLSDGSPMLLGKTNPTISTSGLAATALTFGALTGEPLDRLGIGNVTNAQARATTVESAVVHYGDTTLTFLAGLQRRDADGNAKGYLSLLPVEEKTVIDYNRGDPEASLPPGTDGARPKDQLRAFYPADGTLLSDHPIYSLSATDGQRRVIRQFLDFARAVPQQQLIGSYGFRGFDGKIAAGSPIAAANGVDPAANIVTAARPSGDALNAVLVGWNSSRKPGNVTLLVDVSGSMKDGTPPRLDVAKAAIKAAVSSLRPTDLVSVRAFSTRSSGGRDPFWDELLAARPLGDGIALNVAVDALQPKFDTPLHDAAKAVYADAVTAAKPGSINAVVLISDGQNDPDNNPSDPKSAEVPGLLAELRRLADTAGANPPRLFTVAFGQDAAKPEARDLLVHMAAATDGKEYDAADPNAIAKVLSDILSNF